MPDWQGGHEWHASRSVIPSLPRDLRDLSEVTAWA